MPQWGFAETLDAIYDDWYRRLGTRPPKLRGPEQWAELPGWPPVDDLNIIYFDPTDIDMENTKYDYGCAYRTTDAGGDPGSDFFIDFYLHAALFHLECGTRTLVDEFDRVSPNPEYGWGPGESPLLQHAGIPSAVSALRRVADVVAEYEVDLLVCIAPALREHYRIKCPGSDMRTRLLNLANFLDKAHRAGCNVRFEL